jgi:rhodanese-related sulfurtransferase
MTRMPFWGQGDPPPPFWGHEPVPKIDAERAAEAVAAGALLIDLGTPGEWFAGHLPGARLVEPELFDMELAQLEEGRPLVIAGRDQGLTAEIVGAARERGYDAAMLDGGVSAWSASGRDLLRADGSPVRRS